MAGRIDGLALGMIGAGALFAYAGIKGKSIPGAVQSLIKGQSPATAAKANQITGSSGAGSGGGTGTPPGRAPSGGDKSANLLYVGSYMAANGYTDAAAAGIAACVDGESAGDPEAQGSGGRGLIGWTPPSKLPDSAFTGNESADLTAQCGQILVYNNAQGSGLIQMLNSHTDPVSAAMFYSFHFERPLVPYSDVRSGTANWVYSQLRQGKTGAG